jgi:hypothetical protein
MKRWRQSRRPLYAELIKFKKPRKRLDLIEKNNIHKRLESVKNMGVDKLKKLS